MENEPTTAIVAQEPARNANTTRTDGTPVGGTKVERKRKRNADTQRAAFMASRTPAEAARAINRPGKWLRGIVRDRLGIYVSRGDAWDARAKARAWTEIQKHPSMHSK